MTATAPIAAPRRRVQPDAASAMLPKQSAISDTCALRLKAVRGSGHSVPGGASHHSPAQVVAYMAPLKMPVPIVITSSERLTIQCRGTGREHTRSTTLDSTSPAGSVAR